MTRKEIRQGITSLRLHTKKFGDGVKPLKEEVLDDGSIKFPVEGFASTETKDGSGDIVKVEGIDTTRYEANPIIKRGHKRGEENNIGRVESIEKVPGKGLYIKGSVTLNPEIESHKEVIHGLRHGLINGFSIGFGNVKSAYNSEKEANVIDGLELYEISLVDIPDNPLTIRKFIDMIKTIKKDIGTEEVAEVSEEVVETVEALETKEELVEETKDNGQDTEQNPPTAGHTDNPAYSVDPAPANRASNEEHHELTLRKDYEFVKDSLEVATINQDPLVKGIVGIIRKEQKAVEDGTEMDTATDEVKPGMMKTCHKALFPVKERTREGAQQRWEVNGNKCVKGIEEMTPENNDNPANRPNADEGNPEDQSAEQNGVVSKVPASKSLTIKGMNSTELKVGMIVNYKEVETDYRGMEYVMENDDECCVGKIIDIQTMGSVIEIELEENVMCCETSNKDDEEIEIVETSVENPVLTIKKMVEINDMLVNTDIVICEPFSELVLRPYQEEKDDGVQGQTELPHKSTGNMETKDIDVEETEKATGNGASKLVKTQVKFLSSENTTLKASLEETEKALSDMIITNESLLSINEKLKNDIKEANKVIEKAKRVKLSGGLHFEKSTLGSGKIENIVNLITKGQSNLN